jgi:hypothetical protein
MKNEFKIGDKVAEIGQETNFSGIVIWISSHPHRDTTYIVEFTHHQDGAPVRKPFNMTKTSEELIKI